jgi:Ca2+-binding EF-hand superfamily protein
MSESVGMLPDQRVEEGIRRRQQEAANEPLTLEKTVDKKHVMDIRRALRRKYASRTNLHRIFNQWDRGNKSGISVQDLYHGLNKVGITTTLDQATALHACAVQTDLDPNLSLQEFSDLLFQHDENFGANLKNIPASDPTLERELQ